MKKNALNFGIFEAIIHSVIKENLIPSETQRLAVARNNIIKNVFTGGIKSSARLEAEASPFIGSGDAEGDWEPNDYIEGRVFFPPRYYNSVEQYLRGLREGLYVGAFSVFGVVAERPYAVSDSFSSTKQRVHASILVLAIAEEVCDSWQENGSEAKANQGIVESQVFKGLVFPFAIWNEFIDKSVIRPDIDVSVVGSTRKNIYGKYLGVPDFESAIKNLLSTVQEPIWAHAVRLPANEEDVMLMFS